jgi:tetratricopeptide (TPR) repeat protein
MKALALAAAVSLTFSLAAFAQDSKTSLKPNGAAKQPVEAAANIDVAAIQKKIDDYTAAIKNDPKNDRFYIARGQSYERMGKLSLAEADMNNAILLNPKNRDYFHVRAHLLGVQRRYRESFADYSKAIACGPATSNLFLKQGQAAFLMGDFESAYVAARNAQKMNEDDTETLVLLGSAEQRKGLLQDSLKHLTKAVELSPKDGSILSIRAETYSKLGKGDLAMQDKSKAKELASQR